MPDEHSPDEITIKLRRDQALVLFDWVAKLGPEPRARTVEIDEAELRAMWDLEGALERTLVEPFLPEYRELVAQARARLREGLLRF